MSCPETSALMSEIRSFWFCEIDVSERRGRARGVKSLRAWHSRRETASTTPRHFPSHWKGAIFAQLLSHRSLSFRGLPPRFSFVSFARCCIFLRCCRSQWFQFAVRQLSTSVRLSFPHRRPFHSAFILNSRVVASKRALFLVTMAG